MDQWRSLWYGKSAMAEGETRTGAGKAGGLEPWSMGRLGGGIKHPRRRRRLERSGEGEGVVGAWYRPSTHVTKKSTRGRVSDVGVVTSQACSSPSNNFKLFSESVTAWRLGLLQQIRRLEQIPRASERLQEAEGHQRLQLAGPVSPV